MVAVLYTVHRLILLTFFIFFPAKFIHLFSPHILIVLGIQYVEGSEVQHRINSALKGKNSISQWNIRLLSCSFCYPYLCIPMFSCRAYMTMGSISSALVTFNSISSKTTRKQYTFFSPSSIAYVSNRELALKI